MIPHVFLPNEQAEANKVNENFTYILSLLGELSTPERVQTLTEYLMGFRQNTLLTGTHDTGASGFKFFQIGYNADWNFTGGEWKFSRFISNEEASALRLGAGFFEIHLTSATKGSLNSQLNKVLSIKAAQTGDDYVFLSRGFNIKGVETSSETLDNYRTTQTFFANPKTIYNAQSLQKGITVFKASDYSVPSQAVTVILSTDLVTTDGHFRCYQERSDRHWKYGFVSRDGGQGIVPLGSGTHAGKFVVERTGSISEGSIYVVGYGV